MAQLAGGVELGAGLVMAAQRGEGPAKLVVEATVLRLARDGGLTGLKRGFGLDLVGEAGEADAFGVEVIGLSDTASGFDGRAVWTDERGDQLYSTLRGQPAQGGARIEGTFLGGSGRFAGAQGSYEFTWRYVLETEDGKVQGRAQGVRGRIRVGGAPEPAERPS